jgi:hypothetical protein
VVEAVLNVILSLALLKHYGMYGVVLGTVVEIIIVKLCVLPVFICRAIKLPLRAYLVDTMLATLLKAAVPLGAYFYLIRGLILPDYPRLFACAAAQTILFLPAAYFFSFSGEERQFLRALAASFFDRSVVKTDEASAPA